MAFYGKYRGQVFDNNDPLTRGRLKVIVPGISNSPLTWAEPCVPYAGSKIGWYTMPPKGANVWIDFERGDVDYPIWTGCFWGTEAKDGVPPDATQPEIKVFQTEKMKLILDDKDIKLTAEVVTDNGNMKIILDKNGIVITAKEVTLTVAPDKIELKKTATTIELNDAITLKKDPAKITLSDTIKMENISASAEISQSAIDLENGSASIKMSPLSVSINNGNLEVMP